MADSNPLRVFLAHSKEDGGLILEIFYLLGLDGFAPWIDKKNLIPGHDWKYEIAKAVRESDVVVAFISSSGMDRAGFLHKEIRLAIDVAEQQPDGTIFIVPVRLDDCKMQDRLSHLQWAMPFNLKLSRVVLPPEGGDEIVIEPDAAPIVGRDVCDVYVSLQGLIYRAFQLGKCTKEQFQTRPSPPYLEKGMNLTRVSPGRYLVRGQNPDNSKYYGVARITRSKTELIVAWNIEGQETRGIVEQPVEDGPLLIRGDYEVTVSRRSPSTGVYSCVWGSGGSEQLIPASPIAHRITAH
jgi:hypothetical protein